MANSLLSPGYWLTVISNSSGENGAPICQRCQVQRPIISAHVIVLPRLYPGPLPPRPPAPAGGPSAGRVRKNNRMEFVRQEEAIEGPGLEALRRTHLWLLAGNGLGLLNNKPTPDILRRLQHAYGFRLELNRLRKGRPRWFRQSYRPALPENSLRTCRFAQMTTRDFDFNPVQIFERFAGEGSWVAWVTDGTAIAPEVFCYLKETGLRGLVDQEFALYRHHHHTPSRNFPAWMTAEYLAHQDPVWYALTAAARPGREWRLVSYPYITKDTGSGGEATGLLYMDLNLNTYLAYGSGGNRLTSSLSIDDEDPDGCTVVVKRLHRHLGDWHKRPLQRGWNSSRATTNWNHIYSAEDRETWVGPVPVPCPAWRIRLTLPQLIHGSTAKSIRRRRTILPWYTHVDASHEKLEVDGCPSWNEIRQCHMDLVVPARDPSGYSP
ncbi:hypothetical protein FGG08_006402 [Glutinoglossum americanum]|uniref:Uncharacterized protein n=1 Tax=Glutinoglossum americanum TaxID=1670608 RepID=A0A9P8HYF3_9PEZI|nr:hypothetical protein FGG08_006402 [Glutinoglossum americanum]